MTVSILLGQFGISPAMQPYALRIRLRASHFGIGSDTERTTALEECVSEMKRILVNKGISNSRADLAILRSLEAAYDFQMSKIRYLSQRAMRDKPDDILDRLILSLRQLAMSVMALPPNSKRTLNQRLGGLIDQTPLDSETFIQIIEAIIAALPQIEPRRRADDVLLFIRPEPDRRPPIIDQWEAMPATTRINVERLLGARPSNSLLSWLNNVAGLLDLERPMRKRGPPHAIVRIFVLRIGRIWESLGLKAGLAYRNASRKDDWTIRERRVASVFQRYCHAVLSVVENSTRISARQVDNFKKRKL
jgi:hypothetical protein